MAEQFNSQASPFYIQVMEGDLSTQVLQTGMPRGMLALAGRQMPFRPATYKNKMRIRTDFYPGNPHGRQQPIGIQLEPSNFTGIWKDRYLGDGAAMGLVKMIEDIQFRAASVKVSWGGSISATEEGTSTGGEAIVRVGMIEEFEFKPERVQDIAWSMTFAWRSRGEQAAAPISAVGNVNPRDGFSQASDDLELTGALWQAFKQGPVARGFGLPQSALMAMDDAFQNVTSARDAIDRASSAMVSTAVVPMVAAQQILGAAAQGVQSMITAERQILSLNLLGLEVRDSAIALLQLKDQLFEVLLQAGASKERCSDSAAVMLDHVEPDVIAEVEAPPGTDLRDLAFQFYGSPDYWWAIANANDFESSAVPPNPTGPSDNPARAVRIPRLQSGTSSDLHQQC